MAVASAGFEIDFSHTTSHEMAEVTGGFRQAPGSTVGMRVSSANCILHVYTQILVEVGCNIRILLLYCCTSRSIYSSIG